MRAGVLLLAGALTLTACGSTVQLRGQLSSTGDGLTQQDQAGGTEGPAADGGSTGVAPVGGSSTTASTTGSTSGGSTARTTTGSQTGPARTTTTSGSTHPGSVTATTISIGFIYTTGRQQAAAALGAAGVTSGDELAQWKLLIADVNAHGGLAGRQIKPVFVGESSTSTQTLATTETAACDTFTQDNHVVAALSSFEYTSTFQDCMNKKGVPTFYSLETLNSSAEYQRYGLQFEAGNLALDRQGAELAKGLLGQHYFTGTVPAVNGVIIYDTPAYHAAADALVATLKADGVMVKDVRAIPFAQQSSDTGQIASAISNAELAFAAEGVNHVMIFDLNGLLSLLFMENAQTQGYHPRYGLTSQSSGTHLADLLGGNANAQLKDAAGVGWLPVLDLAAADYPPAKSSAARRQCRDLMIKGGQSQGLSSPGAELVAVGQCDDLYLLKAGMSGLTSVSGALIRQGLDGVGSSFTPGNTFSVAISSRRHDGVSSVRDMGYVTNCSCFRYTSVLRTAS